jgi:hypothetical protein
VTEVGSGGLRVRYSPGGIVVGYLAEGTAVIVIDQPMTLEEETWYHVRSTAKGLEGWVVERYLGPKAVESGP